MRAFILTPALLATLALSKPIEKRVLTTTVAWVTVQTTITIQPNAPTPSDPGSSTVATVYVTEGQEPAPTSSIETIVSPLPSFTRQINSPRPVTTPALATSVVASTPAIVASSPAASPTSGSTGANTYQTTILHQHNIHRANHSASDLTWSEDLASIAETIANSCVYAHDTKTGGGGYGQNIGAGTAPEDVGAMISNEMYNGEIGFYPQPFGSDNPDMSNFEKWGHFSQIVWKDTTQVGCATVKCASLANVGGAVQPFFTVCNYKPAGNFAGEYSNVGAPLGKASVSL